MSKAARLIALLLLVAVVATGCKSPEPEPEPTAEPTPVPTPAPTQFIPTPVPTVTARAMAIEVEYPAEGATPLLVDPITKPSPKPVEFEPYFEYVNARHGIAFEVPSYFERPTEKDEEERPNTLVFMEPSNDIRSGEKAAASLTVAINTLSTVQTQRDAEIYLEQSITAFRADNSTLEVSSMATNSMLGETSVYVTIWLDQTIYDEMGNETGETVRMRGRCQMIPKNQQLYMIYYLCPSNRNEEYLEGLYRHLRSTFRLLEAGE